MGTILCYEKTCIHYLYLSEVISNFDCVNAMRISLSVSTIFNISGAIHEFFINSIQTISIPKQLPFASEQSHEINANQKSNQT